MPEDCEEAIARPRADYEQLARCTLTPPREATGRDHRSAGDARSADPGAGGYACSQGPRGRSHCSGAMIRIANGRAFGAIGWKPPCVWSSRGRSTTWRSTIWPKSPCRSCRSSGRRTPNSAMRATFRRSSPHRPTDPRTRHQGHRQCRRRKSDGLCARSATARAGLEGRGRAGRRRTRPRSTNSSPRLRHVRYGYRRAAHHHSRPHPRANAYIGAFPLAEALATGADVVITGRCTDAALALAPMIHRFGWGPDDYDKLAAGTIAGHIIECGAQCDRRQLPGRLAEPPGPG